MSDQALAKADEPALESHIETFTAALLGRGYCAGTVRLKCAMLARFALWIGKRRIAVRNFDEATIGVFLAHLRRRGVPIGNRRCTLLAFLEHLRQEGATRRPAPVHDQSESAQLLRRYQVYLREEQGLTAETADNYLRFASQLVRGHVPDSAAETAVVGLEAQQVRDFLLRSVRELRPTTAQLRATALRSFLRFLFLRGETKVNLADAVPSVRRWRKATTHTFLQPKEVDQLLRACDCGTATGRRDHAVLLLLARLGMRAREVSAMQLEDLRWRAGEILVRGKGAVHQRLPLLPEVGAAIARYLRDGRPRSQCRNVFLRDDAPRVALGADAIGLIVRRALHRAGLHPSHRGSHLLRHSLATHMIRCGATMAQIGEVLRHRLPETTEIYAKLDFEALRAVALPWPGGVR